MVKSNTSILLLKKLCRSIKTNYKQFISIIAISFLSICLFCGLTANAENFAARVNRLYSETNFADIYLTTTSNKNIIFEDINRLDGVEKAEERTYFTAVHEKSSINIIVEEKTNVLSSPQIIEGEKGFLVTKSFAEDKSLNNGDNFDFTIDNYIKNSSIGSFLPMLSSYKKEGKVDFLNEEEIALSFEISGIMYHPEGVQSSSFSPTVTLIEQSRFLDKIITMMEENYDIETLNKTLGSLGINFTDILKDVISDLANQVLVKAKKGAVLEELNASLKNKVSSYEDTNVVISITSDNLPSYLALDQDVNQAKKLTYVFPVIFFLVSILVILSTLSQMILKERTQIGSLKAIGVKKSKIYAHYMSYGFFLCLIGGLIGFFVGPLLIPNVMEIKYKLLWDIPYSKPGFFYPMSILITSLLILISSLATFLVSHTVISERPAYTLRAKVPTIKTKVREKENFVVERLPITTKLAFRNIMSNKIKSLMVIIGTIGCTALLVCGFGVMDTLNYGINVSYNEQLKTDITIIPNEYVITDKVELEKIDYVKKVEEAIIYPLMLAGKDKTVNTNINLVEDNSVCFKIDYSGEGIVLDRTTAENIDTKEGEEVTLIINNKPIVKKVDKVFDTSLLHGVFASATYYKDLELKANRYWLRLEDTKYEDMVKNEIQEKFSFSSVQTSTEIFKYANDLLGSIMNMTNVIKIFAVLLAIVVIYNLTSLNINERYRDIATMKVLGFNYQEITKTLMLEMVIETLIGTTIGLFLGLPMCVLVLSINKTNLLTFLYHIDWTSYLIAFVLSFFTAIFVNILLCLRLKKIKMVESLKSVE